MPRAIDADLENWSDVAERDWPTLVVGNGLSINLWAGFEYASLFTIAALTPAAEALFEELGTTNFEHGLQSIHHGRITNRALNEPTERVDELYADVRDALFRAVAEAHIPWDLFPQTTHELLASTMDKHKAVFTTNYDLCLYWSQLQAVSPVSIVDFFWSNDNQFDPSNTDLWSTRTTALYFLHGGLHLWQDSHTGANGKWTTSTGRLLDMAPRYTTTSDRRPLFVSEGTAEAKARTIRQSPYLSFCLEALRADESPTLIFGHSLSAQDQHIAEALRSGRARPIAVSMHPTAEENAIIEAKARLQQLLAGHQLTFFDSTTSPLGDLGLRVPAS